MPVTDEEADVEPHQVLRVGCALLPKKVSRYLTPSVKAAAAARGVELTLLDSDRPIEAQGPFDAIIHKLRPNAEWEANLQSFSKQHPEVTVINDMQGIRTLHDRATMLSPLQADDGIVIHAPAHPACPQQHSSEGNNTPAAGVQGPGEPVQCSVRVRAPQQVEVLEGMSLAEVQQLLLSAGLLPPLLVKPKWSDGREGSHALAVLHDVAAMEPLLQGHVSASLKPPVVVQQFVEHGGVLYKVYVIGDRTVVSTRPSLSELHMGREAQRQGVLSLPRISCKTGYGTPGSASGSLADVSAAASTSCLDLVSLNTAQSTPPAGTEPGSVAITAAVADTGCSNGGTGSSSSGFSPPHWAMHELAAVLRQRLGMQLFNFDLICPDNQPHCPAEWLCYVVDINSFPGIDKVPDFEEVYADFLWSQATGHPQQSKPWLNLVEG